jgi:hypothetical protein
LKRHKLLDSKTLNSNGRQYIANINNTNHSSFQPQAVFVNYVTNCTTNNCWSCCRQCHKPQNECWLYIVDHYYLMFYCRVICVVSNCCIVDFCSILLHFMEKFKFHVGGNPSTWKKKKNHSSFQPQAVFFDYVTNCSTSNCWSWVDNVTNHKMNHSSVKSQAAAVNKMTFQINS